MASNFRARRYRYDFVAATVKLMKNGLAPSSEQKKKLFFYNNVQRNAALKTTLCIQSLHVSTVQVIVKHDIMMNNVMYCRHTSNICITYKLFNFIM